MSKYHLPDGYIERLDNPEWDDTENTDEWQLEVYLLAKKLCIDNGYKIVCDLGCGSGYKLVTYLGEFETIGIELPKTVEYLRGKYPQRIWLDYGDDIPDCDLVICADVIEHVRNPNEVMRFIKALFPKKIVLSTPERDVRKEPRLGPPSHWPHCREWNLEEFKAYVEDWFKIEQGPLIFGPQFVQQLVVCSPK